MAVVATARKILAIIWHLLSGGDMYRNRQVQMIARKFLEWGWRLGKKHRSGSSSAFALERLRQVQINHVTQTRRGRHAYHLTGTA